MSQAQFSKGYASIAHRLVYDLRAFSLTHTVIFLIVFVVMGQLFYPVEYERWLALEILDGNVPYRDIAIEYPPLALAIIVLPALLFSSPLGYDLVFSTTLLVANLLSIHMIAGLARRWQTSVSGALMVYTAFVIAIGPIVTRRYDLLPSVLVLLALYSFIKGRNRIAWAVLALGVTAKLYPIIVAPIFALYHLRRREYRSLAEGSVTFVGVVLLITVPWIIVGGEGLLNSFTYHMERPLHVETTYASLLLVGQLLGIVTVESEFGYGSWNLRSPLADVIADTSMIVASILLLVCYSLLVWHLWRSPRSFAAVGSPAAGRNLLRFSILAIAGFLLASKVFSPQFLVWLLPLLPLVTDSRRQLIWVFFFVALALTQVIFPHYYYVESMMDRPLLIIMIALRNLLVSGVVASVAWQVIQCHVEGVTGGTERR